MNVEAVQGRGELSPLLPWSLFVGLVASLTCIIGGVFAPQAFFHAYAFAYFFFLGLPLGGLVLVMIHHLIGGAWGLLVRRIAEAQMKTLPLMALLFIPIGFGLQHIYPWAEPRSQTTAPHPTLQERYLRPDLVCWRAVVYFAVWLTLTFLLTLWSRDESETEEASAAWKCYKLSGFGAVLFGVTLHFAAIDWLMSLQPKFTSTIFGPLVFSGQLLTAYAAAVAIFGWLVGRPEYQRALSTKATNDLGSLLFTLLILWAYMVWFQYMLVWIADLSHGTVWYLARLRGGWNWLALMLVALHFVIPFFLLLLRSVKRNPTLLGYVAALILVAHLLFMYLEIMPAFTASPLVAHLLDVLAPIGMGGIWLACFTWLLMRRPLLPEYDLNLAHAIHLQDLEEKESAREEAFAHA